jgi:hypothetical protein
MKKYYEQLSRILNDLNFTPEFGEIFWAFKAELLRKGYEIDSTENGIYIVKGKKP